MDFKSTPYTPERRARVVEILTPLVGSLSAQIIGEFLPVMLTRKNRETGTMILVGQAPSVSSDGDDGWSTFCLDHQNDCTHSTRDLAVSWASQPSGWCPACRNINNGRDVDSPVAC